MYTVANVLPPPSLNQKLTKSMRPLSADYRYMVYVGYPTLPYPSLAHPINISPYFTLLYLTLPCIWAAGDSTT